MPDGFWWNFGVQVAIAIGTVGACLVALFGPLLKGRVFPPKLKLQLENDAGLPSPIELHPPGGGTPRIEESRWYHVRVTNERRWSPAAGVQIFIVELAEPTAVGDYQSVWTGEMPLRWQHQEAYPLARTIGSSACADLCSVVREKWVEIHPLIDLYALKRRFNSKCDIRIKLQARGVDVDSEFLLVKIVWNGKWSEDTQTMKTHMVVKQIR